MKSKKKPSLCEHIEIADEMAIAAHHLAQIYVKLQEHYPKNSKLLKMVWKLFPYQLTGTFSKIKNLLDDDFHKVITEDQFMQLGHIYYKLEERYSNIQQRQVCQ